MDICCSIFSKSNRSTQLGAFYLALGLSFPCTENYFDFVGLSKKSKMSDGVVTRDPIEPPREVTAVDITSSSITLKWRRPEYDGGAKITGYFIEKLDLPDGHWMKLNFNKV